MARMDLRTMTALVGVAGLAIAGCAGTRGPDVATDPGGQSASGERLSVEADLRDPTNRTRARAEIAQVGDSIRVKIASAGLAAGAYGAHLHAVGRCDAPTFESAGAHWNPGGQMHGKDNPQGMHKGDLPNLLVGADGQGRFEFTVPDASLTGGGVRTLLDGDGAAVVIHQRPDDYRSDPAGNSGARIACGVLG